MAERQTRASQRAESHESVISVDAEHRVVAWDEGATRLLGLSARELRGRQLGEVLRARDAFGNVFCPAGCWLHEMARRREPVNIFVLEVERPEGKPQKHWVDLEVHNRGVPPAGYRLTLRLRRDRRRMEEQLLNGPRPAPAGDGLPRLTVRQREVLSLAADGHSTSAIARRLGISISTVQKHQQNALRALDTHHLPAAVATALRRGLI